MSPQILPATKAWRAERRFASRMRNPCRIMRLTVEMPCWGTVHNISAHGAALVADHAFRQGTFLGVELPGAFGQVRTTRLMRVTHCEPRPGNHWYSLGGAFTQRLPREELERIQARTAVIVRPNERRSQLRQPTRMNRPVRLTTCKVVSTPGWATLRNFSLHGISLITDQPVAPNAFYSIEFPLHPRGLTGPKLLRVVHGHRQPGSPWWVLGGVLLSPFSRAELAALRQFG